MFEGARAWLVAQLLAAKPSFVSRSPHFNFISAHYFWIIGMTFLASILIIATAGGDLDYIDALFFASGANTQAGLNTVNTNQLNTFQQVVIFLFTMISNPITIHSSVVWLRIYWFEKHFLDLTRQARMRRATFSKSRNKPSTDSNQVERGVAGRHITVMPNTGSRITNDGIVLDKQHGDDSQDSPGSSGINVPNSDAFEHRTADNQRSQSDPHVPRSSFSTAGVRSEDSDAGIRQFNPAAVDTQHHGDEEVLRIPNPRDADRGMKPQELHEGQPAEADDEEGDDDRPSHQRFGKSAQRSPRDASAVSANNRRQRQATITIAEPPRPPGRSARSNNFQGASKSSTNNLDEIAEEADASAPASGRFKFPRLGLFGRDDNGEQVDEDDENVPNRRNSRRRSSTFEVIRRALTGERAEEAPYLSWTPTLGRNSQFPGLTLEQREELGGIEYRSLRTLALILFIYFWFFWIIAVVCFLPWILDNANNQYGQAVTDADQGLTWWGFFTANSAFLDLGFTLTPDSMAQFATSQYILIIMAFFIIVGNTGFPVMLRGLIWLTALIVPRQSPLWHELRFLLDHPRRCFTLLFPSAATWWLFWILIGLNALDLIFFIVLDLDADPVISLPVHLRIVNGLFQAACTRTAGFSSVPTAELHPAVQVSYMMMMYISVFPIAISIRRTNVYEEKSLGIYNSPDEDEDPNESSTMSYVGNHLRRQLSFDLWYIFLGLFVLCITEGGKIQRNEFSVYSVLFELISAYGTVGLSLGYSAGSESLSSQFSTLGKLVIIAMMIRGRHRGLPYGLDRAVLLPSAKRLEEEAKVPQPGLTRQVTQLTHRTSGTTTGADAGTRRGRSRDRGIISSFLHPGPPVSREEKALSNQGRRMSFDYGHYRPEGEDLNRSNTEPYAEDSFSNEDERPARARRVYTTPGG